MERYKITVRDDPHDDAFSAVGEFLDRVSRADFGLEIWETHEDSGVYVVKASAKAAEMLRGHGDIEKVLALT